MTSTDSRRWRTVDRRFGDTLVASGGAVYGYDAVPKIRNARRFIVVSHGTVTSRTTPCRDAWSQVVIPSSRTRLVVVCGNEPGMGEQIKRSYLSVDGGRTWRSTGSAPIVGYAETGGAGSDAVFVTGGRMSLWASANGGRHWRLAVLGSGTAGGFAAVGFSRGRFGWAVDPGPPTGLYLSADGGRHWHRARAPA